MVQEELKRLHNDPNFSDLYAQGINSLKRAGVFELMRLLGQPYLVSDGSDTPALAAQAARSVGWNAAINTLLHIETLITEAVQPDTKPRMQYGGLEAAVLRGDLLREEKNAIELGLKPDPSIYKPKFYNDPIVK